jgi:hypothetical protein
MRLVDGLRAISVSARTFSLRWVFPAALAALFAVTLAAQPQSPCPFQPGTPANPQKAFYANFANSAYEIPLSAQTGPGWQSDRNSTYFPLFYSIANANRNFPPNCQFELVIVGDFPDARYFSITVNDQHKTATQHLVDAAIDPVGSGVATSANPFVPGANGSSPSYSGAQPYLVPISLGAVPSLTAITPGCQINSFEEDNLLDATQRHLSNDWNTNLQPPNIASGLAPHVVNTPGNDNPNTAGSIIVRTYSPWVTCPGGPNTCTSRPAGVQPYSGQPHLIVRDVATGCAFTAQEVTNYLLYYKQCIGPCATPDTAIVSMTDPSLFDPNWLDVSQETHHSHYASITPQACYANGSPTQTNPPSSGPPYFYNRVAWARSPEWLPDAGPDDSYIGGAIIPSDLAHMQPAAKNPACSQVNKGDGCVMRLRFQLPNMPTTPCGPPYTCTLASNVDLRYMSLTFWYYSSSGNGGGFSPFSIISLADDAFARSSSGLVTLLVNVATNSQTGQSALPAWLQQTQAPNPCATVPPTGNCLVQQGVAPVSNDMRTNPYSLWTVNGYTVLDLTQFDNFQDVCPNGICGLPLLLELRNTMPSSTFTSSGAAVPFNSAEYTNADGAGGGLMGPYAPLVDYVDPNDPSLPPSGAPSFSLPASTLLPLSPPNLNAPALSPNNDCVTAGASCVNFPNQYWSTTSTKPPNLYCPTTAPTEPETAIYFVATQFPTPALTFFPAAPPGPTPCATPGYCSQIVAASSQTAQEPSGTAFQPPVTLTIAGTGFGYLPQLPQAVQGSPYLDVNDCAANMTCAPYTWDSATATSCQMYISNWTDSSISLVANLAAGVQNQYQQENFLGSVLSPFNDFTPLTFLAAPGCPINAGDNLTFTVTNPQNGATSSLAATVLPAGTMLY